MAWCCDDSIDFEDVLEQELVLIRCRKWLADFIKEEKSDWKFTSHPKDQPNVLTLCPQLYFRPPLLPLRAYKYLLLNFIHPELKRLILIS